MADKDSVYIEAQGPYDGVSGVELPFNGVAAEYSKQLQNDYAFHQLSGAQAFRQTQIRGACHHLAQRMTEMCRPGKELDAALEAVDLAGMWATAAIEREQ